MSVGLLESLIVVKTHLVSRKEKCYTKTFSESFYTRANSATYQALQVRSLGELEQAESDNMDAVSREVLKMLCVSDSDCNKK